MGMGETLTKRWGPLPVWLWALIFVGGLGGYLMYRNKQNANTQQANTQGLSSSSNLGTVPVSNLTTAAQPMPINMGDTFINNNVPPTQVSVEPGNWQTEPLRCAGNGPQRLLCRKAIAQQKTLQGTGPVYNGPAKGLRPSPPIFQGGPVPVMSGTFPGGQTMSGQNG